MGQLSLSNLMGFREEMEVDIWLPYQISVPPVGWISAMRWVAMLLTIMDGQLNGRPLWEWKTSYRDQWRNLVAACWREAHAVVPRAYRPAVRKEVGRFQTFLEIFSTTESTS
jgi:hypothetical protein